MKVSDLFPKKELTEKEMLERKFKKDLKRIERKLFRNPFGIMERVEETSVLMDNAIKDGIMTQKEKDEQMKKFNDGILKFSSKSEKFKNFMKGKKFKEDE